MPLLSGDEAVKAKQKADYLTALWAAGADCRSVVEWHKSWWDKQKK